MTTVIYSSLPINANPETVEHQNPDFEQLIIIQIPALYVYGPNYPKSRPASLDPIIYTVNVRNRNYFRFWTLHFRLIPRHSKNSEIQTKLDHFV